MQTVEMMEVKSRMQKNEFEDHVNKFSGEQRSKLGLLRLRLHPESYIKKIKKYDQKADHDQRVLPIKSKCRFAQKLPQARSDANEIGYEDVFHSTRKFIDPVHE